MKIRSKIEMTARDMGVYAAAATKKALAKSADVVAALPESTRGAIKGARKLAGRVEPVVAPVVEAQLETLEVMATMGAKRLKAASEAESFDGLVAGQVALFPETKAAALTETRKYLEMFFATKEKVDEAMKTKVLGWVTPKAPKVRKAAAQPAAAAA
jgi:hypothetical protein